MKNQNEITLLSIKDLFEKDSKKYLIPIYQRNYEWEFQHINQLIEDIKDSAIKNKEVIYYLGTLVVKKRSSNNETKQIIETFETLDGQQRLTTLNLICYVLSKKSIYPFSECFEQNLEFECRNSQIDENSQNSHIAAGYKIIERIFDQWDKDNPNISIKDFTEYLTNNVKIIRVEVPDGTDLNHYFEIMNTRGEQLEKHEILKAKFLENLQKSPQKAERFNQIWQACANMDKYAIQNIKSELRKKIFVNRDSLLVINPDKLFNFDQISQDTTTKEKNSLLKIISETEKVNSLKNNENKNQDNGTKFSSIVNFENFLLIVLNIYLRHKSNNSEQPSLNDKELLTEFDKNKEVIKDAENFIHILLKVRLLFDEFVIKRHELDSKEDWSLKRVIYDKDDNLQLINTYSEKNKIEVDTETKSDAQRKLLMLLSMFHVSFPTQTYKYWLLGVLDYLYSAQTVDTKNYISYINYTNYLETLAYNLMKMRFLVDESLDYHQIIFKQDKNTSNVDQNIEKYLSYQEIKHNFVFNYVDYILWQNDAIKSQSKASFKFTFRNSVEHFYPQNDDYVKKLTSEYQRNEIIHSFGNLCLISHSLNSKLSNHSSTEKKNYIQENKIHQSLKLSLMLEEKEWNGDAILKHHDDILKKLISALN